ncbi:MAG: hypothetical protein ACXVJF_16010 [Acidimicrobiia bacterium]
MPAVQKRRIAWCFAGLAALAAGYYVYIGRNGWFWFDEWFFLTARTAGNLDDLLRPHTDVHWSTLPVLVWRAMWWIFGLRSYRPYMVLTVLAHITIAGLLRVVIRRAGVRPWIATFVAGIFLFFGTGAYNIIWAFQINFDGAVALGLTQLLLADHDGPLDRRDWWGLGAGLLALMCSAPAVTMVIVVGIAVLIRRGPRAAAFHTVPLGAIFYLWWWGYSTSATLKPSLHTTWNFLDHGIRATFGALGGSAIAGWLIGAVLIVGWVVIAARPDVRRSTIAAPFAMACGVPVFFVITGSGRELFGPTQTRYLYIAAALLVPAFAVAFEQLVRRWWVLAPVPCALLLVGVPSNLRAASDFAHQEASSAAADRSMVLSVTHSPGAHGVPRSLRPDPFNLPLITMGWLLDGEASGRIPTRATSDPRILATNALRLSLLETDRAPRGRPCTPLSRPVTRRLDKGDSFGVRNGSVAVIEFAPDPKAAHLRFGASFHNPRPGFTITDIAGPLVIVIAPTPNYLRLPLLC